MFSKQIFVTILLAAAGTQAMPSVSQRQAGGTVTVSFYPTSDTGCNKNDAFSKNFVISNEPGCLPIDLPQAVGSTGLEAMRLTLGCKIAFYSTADCTDGNHFDLFWNDQAPLCRAQRVRSALITC